MPLSDLTRLVGRVLLRRASGVDAPVPQETSLAEQALQIAGVGVWQWEIGSDTITWSREARVIMRGLEADDGGPRTMSREAAGERMLPEDRELAGAEVRRALASGDVAVTQFRVRTEGGGLRWAASRGRAVYDGAGRPVRMVGVLQDISALKAQEQAVRDGARLLQTIEDSVGDQIAVLDREGRVVTVNAAWREFAEAHPQANAVAIGANLVDALRHAGSPGARDEQACAEGIAAVLAGSVTRFARTLAIGSCDGGERWFELRATPLRLPAGGAVVLRSDVTERVRAEAALRASEARFHAAFEHSALGMAEVDADGVCLDANRRLCRMLGRRREDLLGCRWEHLVHEGDRAAHLAAMRELASGALDSSVRHERLVRQDGETIWVALYSAPVVDGPTNAPVVIHTLEDISRERVAQVDLARVQARYRAIVEQSPNAIWLTEGGRVALVNQACVDLFGAHDAAEMLGRPVEEFLPPEGRPDTPPATPPRLNGRHVVTVHPIRRRDGEWREVESHSAQVPDHGQIAMQTVMRDVTERNRAARLLRDSREELRRLSANLIHVREEERRRIARELHDELGQRLTAVKMQLGAMASAAAAAGRAAQGGAHGASGNLVSAEPALREAMGRIDELVAAVRRIAADLRPAMLDDLGLEAAIEWLAADCARHAGLAVQVHCERLPATIPDNVRTAAYRIVQEALNNVVRHAQATQVQIVVEHDDDHLAVVVTDDGIGLREGATLKPESHGIVGMRERARLLGGTLQLRANPGRGCRIELRLPLHGGTSADTLTDSLENV